MVFNLILFYLFFVLNRPHEYINLFMGFPIVTLLLVGSFGTWILSKYKLIISPQLIIFPLLVLMMMFSHMVNGWFGGAIQIMWKMIPLFILFMVLSSVVDDYKKMDAVFKVIVGCVVIMAIHGIDQKNMGIGWTGAQLSQQTRITYIGIFNDPNDLGLVMVMALPMAIYLFLEAKNKIWKYIWVSSVSLILYGIYLTESRGSLLSVLAIGAVYLSKRIGIMKTAMIGLVASPMAVLLSGRMTEIDPTEASAAGRVEAWYEGIQMFISYPLFGVGPNQFVEHNVLTAHNSFYLVLAELGFVGYTFWLTLLLISTLMVFKASLINRRVSTEAEDKTGIDNSLQDRSKDKGIESKTPEVDVISKQSYAIFLAMIGYLSAAFFLSRSYNIVLFILCALCVSVFYIMREHNTEIKAINFGGYIGRYIGFSIISIIGLYVIVKILLKLM